MMTLPNRPGYSVGERSGSGGSNGISNGSSRADPSSEEQQHLAQQLKLVSAYLPPSSHHLHHHHHGLLPPDLASHIAYVTTPQASFPLTNMKQDVQRFQKGNTSTSSTSSYGLIDHLVSDLTPSPTLSFDPFKPHHPHALEKLSPEEIHDKKVYVQKHRLHPHMLQIIEYCKKEGIIPGLSSSSIQPLPAMDYSLAEFLETQGIESIEEDEILRGDEFAFKLQQLKIAYNEELDKLNKVCQDFVSRMVSLLREQGQVRLVSDQEVQAKTILIQNKFDYVRHQLRTNVCNAILVLQKQYHQHTKKRRRSLSKKATDALNLWFFEHINDPYPSDEEKGMLAAQCVLSLNQVNNWFGNKRIRYKRKCLEDETRMRQAAKNNGTNGANAPPSMCTSALSPSPVDMGVTTPSSAVIASHSPVITPQSPVGPQI